VTPEGKFFVGEFTKNRQLFQEKIGVTPSVADPGDTNSCDATAPQLQHPIFPEKAVCSL